MTSLVKCKRVVAAEIAHPFGDERIVNQAFPAAIPAEEADPFLMCDDFSFIADRSSTSSPDEFPIDWHPHRGMDLLSYMKKGGGRHGDSMGNRETFESPGIQWISAGSGIEHAEGGGTVVAGQERAGFQIWVNVPGTEKMKDPRYGTHPPSDIPPVVAAPGVTARVLAGPLFDRVGPFATAVKELQVIDYELAAGASVTHTLPAGYNTCIVYAYKGAGDCSGSTMGLKSVALLDADADAREVVLTAGAAGMEAMLFAGKRLNEPIAWRGPIVMNTQAQLQECFAELRRGTFPPVRAPYDYKRLAAFPKK